MKLTKAQIDVLKTADSKDRVAGNVHARRKLLSLGLVSYEYRDDSIAYRITDAGRAVLTEALMRIANTSFDTKAQDWAAAAIAATEAKE